MAEPTLVPAGNESSEYKLTQIANIVSTIIIAAGGALEAFPVEGRPAWVGVAIMLIGVTSKLLHNLGYGKIRKEVKIAAMLASGAAKAVSEAPDAPAKADDKSTPSPS